MIFVNFSLLMLIKKLRKADGISRGTMVASFAHKVLEERSTCKVFEIIHVKSGVKSWYVALHSKENMDA
jgi:hypothetical protein